MKIFKYIQIALVMLLVGGLTSCSENDYWDGATTQSGYTFNSNSQSFTFTNNDVFETVNIPVTRSTTTGEATLPITATFSSEKLSGPESVTFADGENTANYVITCKDFEMGEEQTAILEFDDELCSSAGKDSTHVSILLDYVWNSIGEGLYVDNYWMDHYYDVEFLQNETLPNRFRVVQPYDSFISDAGGKASGLMGKYLEFWVCSKGDVVKGVTIPEDGMVYFPDYCTGYQHSSYGDTYLYHPSRLRSYATNPSYWSANTVLQYQENGLPAEVQLAPYYYFPAAGGGYNCTQYSGVIDIVFPGVKVYDYSAKLTYNGRTINTEDKEYVNVTATLGEDVAKATIAVVPGDVKTALSAILNGTATNSIDVTESGDYSIELTNPVTGTYTVMIVTFDAEGEAQSYNYAQFKYTAGAQEETWTAVGTGTYTYTLFFGSASQPQTDEGLTLYQSNQDKTRYKIEHWGYDVDFVFTMDASGNVVVEDQSTGTEYSSYGEVSVVDLVTYTGGTAYGQSSYSNGTFNFAVCYYVKDGSLTYGTETFVLDNTSAKQHTLATPMLSAKPSRIAFGGPTKWDQQKQELDKLFQSLKK